MIGADESRIMAWLAGGFVWVLGVDLFVESQRRSFRARVAALAARRGPAGDRAVARHRTIWVSRPLLLAGLTLLLTVAGHLGSGESNDNLWLFNHRLWLGALLAGVGAGLLAAGLIAIHETIKLLFGLTHRAERSGIYSGR